MLSRIADVAVRAIEWVPLVGWAMAAYVKGGAVGFFEGDRPDWQKRLAIVLSTLAIASTLGLAWVGSAAIFTDLRKLPNIVLDFETSGPLADVRSMAERALSNNEAALRLLKEDICERNDVPGSVCEYWLANGRPDNLRRQ